MLKKKKKKALIKDLLPKAIRILVSPTFECKATYWQNYI